MSATALGYAGPGTFLPVERPMFGFEPGWAIYLAACGACGVRQECGVRDTRRIEPRVAFEAIGWSISEGRVRCPFCTGRLPRPRTAPFPLPDPPRSEAP